MVNLAIFASGSGSNAENIADYFLDSKQIHVSLIVTNNQNAGVIDRAIRLGIPVVVFSKQDFFAASKVIDILHEYQIDHIVLAGFLLLVPKKLILAFLGKIINIHPALLPHHGGKSFYGNKVHEHVIASKSPISGITIHHVNEKFDEGEIIFQAACCVDKNDSPLDLANKIHQLEYSYFPVVIEKTILSPLISR